MERLSSAGHRRPQPSDERALLHGQAASVTALLSNGHGCTSMDSLGVSQLIQEAYFPTP